MLMIDIPDLSRALLTASLTIIGGVIIIVVGQIIEKFYIAPYDRFRRTLGDVSFNMIYYANVYTSPGLGDKATLDEASNKLRSLASQLLSDSSAVNGYWFFAATRLIPARRQVGEAAGKLIALSNSVYKGDVFVIDKWRKEVSSLLRLDIFQ